MQFHAEFTYQPQEREKLFHFLDAGALKTATSLKIIGAWLAVETGIGFAILETDDAKALYQLCAAWSEYGACKVTPLLGVKEIPVP
jgi:hypothetical protein